MTASASWLLRQDRIIEYCIRKKASVKKKVENPILQDANRTCGNWHCTTLRVKRKDIQNFRISKATIRVKHETQ